jgi:peroxiredoxin
MDNGIESALGAISARKEVFRMTQPRHLWILGVLTVLIVMVLLAAGGDKATSAQSARQTVVPAAAVGSPAPPFRLTTIDGQQYSLASLRGRTVILFAMFASCADCIPEGKTLSQIQQAYAGKGVTILGVDIVAEESVDALRQYQRVGHITIPLAAYSTEVVRHHQLVQPDMTYVIGRDGIIKYKNARALSYADFQQELNALR